MLMEAKRIPVSESYSNFSLKCLYVYNGADLRIMYKNNYLIDRF